MQELDHKIVNVLKDATILQMIFLELLSASIASQKYLLIQLSNVLIK